MNRVSAVAPAMTAVVTAAAGVILGTAPAYAARPAPRHAAQTQATQVHTAQAHAAQAQAAQPHADQRHADQRRASQRRPAQAGMYVSVVKCSGRSAPVLAAPVTPTGGLEFRNGTDPQNAKIVAKPPQAYHRVFTCTVVVLRKPGAPHRRYRRHRVPVVLETGFGGAARAVARHHPAG